MLVYCDHKFSENEEHKRGMNLTEEWTMQSEAVISETIRDEIGLEEAWLKADTTEEFMMISISREILGMSKNVTRNRRRHERAESIILLDKDHL